MSSRRPKSAPAPKARRSLALSKYRNWVSPFFTMIFIYFSVIAIVTALTEFCFPDYKHAPLPESANTMSLTLICYTIFMISIRFWECGAYVFYESVWCCNLAMILAAFGLYSNRPMLIATAFAGVSMDQLMWYVDCLSYLIIGKFPVGAAKYLVWPNTQLSKKVTCFHHLLFLPLCLYALSFDLPPYSFFFGSFFTSISTAMCRFLTPYEIADPSDPSIIHYLNVNCGFEFWRDVKIKFLHKMDGMPPYIWLPAFAIWGNGLLNGPSYLFFLGVCKLIKSN